MGRTINRTNLDITSPATSASPTPWEVAAVDAIDAQARADQSRRWWQAAAAHVRDIPKTVDWAVISFAVGVSLYFLMPFEIGIWAAFAAAMAAALLWYVSEKRELPWQGVAIIVFAVFGFTRATWHTHAAATPFLDEGFYSVTGWVEDVQPSKSGERWHIRVHDIEGRGAVQNVKRIRVQVHNAQARAGDGINISAVLSAPPGPVVPSGYDPARRAFFEALSGTGYATAKPGAIELESRNFEERIDRFVTRFRYRIAERILQQAPETTAGLQVALLTGIRSFIPQADTEALRAAGLAHVLAISGLHMGLLAGGAYWLSCLLLASVAPLSRRYDVRKAAAVIGAFAATCYLILSGASVATQRAYVMAIIVFLAVLLDRRAFSIRSVSIAAFLTLSLHPESLMSAGFQMSFSAVIALVVVYQHWHGPAHNERGLLTRFGSGLATLSITSFVAGAATGAYAIMHFNRLAKFGFVGNLLAMPIFTFCVMPAALGALIAMPFGLEWLPLQIMGWGLERLLSVARWIESWPEALVHIKSPPNWVIGAYSLAFLWLFLAKKRVKLMACAVFGVCLLSWAVRDVPDIRISDSGRVAILVPHQELAGEVAEKKPATVYVSSARADSYGREQFIQRAGLEGAEVEKYKDNLALCDALACRLSVKGKIVSIINHPSEAQEECQSASLVILVERQAGPVARRSCKEKLLDSRNFKANGAYDIYVSSGGISFEISNPPKRKARPWGVESYRRD